MDPFDLTPGDAISPTWIRLKQHLQDRLESYRIKNDGKMSEQDRWILLGQIREVKRLLGME